MKKIKAIVLSLVLILSIFNINSYADTKTEMRGVWISSVHNMDWPKTKNNIQKQQSEYIELLDTLKSVGMNTVIVQIRPKSVWIYKSSFIPWSE